MVLSIYGIEGIRQFFVPGRYMMVLAPGPLFLGVKFRADTVPQRLCFFSATGRILRRPPFLGSGCQSSMALWFLSVMLASAKSVIGKNDHILSGS
jgi:hypothetical protein